MAISTPTNLTNGSSTSTVTSVTSASFSPSANALLLMWQVVRSNTSAFTPVLDVDPTTTLSGGLTLDGGNYFENGTSGGGMWTGRLWVAKVGSSPGSGTVTFGADTGGTLNRWVWCIAQVASGFDSTTPVRQWTSNNSGSSPLTLTFVSSPLSGNLGFGGFLVVGAFSPTPTDSYTELLETAFIESGTSHKAQLQYRDSPGTTCGITNGSNVRNLGVAIEVAAASAAPSTRIRRSFLI